MCSQGVFVERAVESYCTPYPLIVASFPTHSRLQSLSFLHLNVTPVQETVATPDDLD